MPKSKYGKDIKILPVLRTYTRAALRYPGRCIALILSVITIQVAGLIAPLYLRQFIDTLSHSVPNAAVLHTLLLALGGYALFSFVNWLAGRASMISTMQLEVRTMANLTNDAFSYLVGHSYEFFIDNFAGTLTRRVTRYARAFEPVVDSIIGNILPTLFFALGVSFVLFLRNHYLGLGLFTWTVLFVLLQFFMTQWRYKYKILRTIQDSRMTGILSDSIGNNSSVVFFGAQESEKKLVGDVVEDWRAATTRSWAADAFNYAVQGFLSFGVQVGVLLAALFLWFYGLITIGDVVLIQVYTVSLTGRVGNIGSNIRQLYDAFADAYEMIEILETPHAIQDKQGAAALIVTNGALEFADVSFLFDARKSVLEHFTMAIPAKQKVALVGPSGAGKTTLTKLILRLYDVSGGAIRIDGTDIRDVTQVSLREAVAFVPQEPVLFHRTLRENISFGKQDASLEEVIAAAKQAHCHEFIDALPEKYETYVGERGIKLSGGERQRVAIARAILKNAPILVLDEATSSLDSESEHLIQDALATLMQGKTVIVIAHRLSTIMKMDRIVVIEGGKIAAQGTHEDLLAEGGLYHKLWSIQAGGFVVDQEESAT